MRRRSGGYRVVPPFFFQAEDGIRDIGVTGVQTCALPISWNPYSLLEPGFQLSFSAVAAIFVVVPRIERILEGYPVPKSLGAVVAVSGACGLVTAPILLVQFGSVPLYSVLSNALVAPLVGLSF